MSEPTPEETPEQPAPRDESGTTGAGPAGTAPAGEPAPEATSGSDARDEAAAEAREGGRAQTVPLAALPASELAGTFLSLLAMKAWEGMGLVPNPLTGKTEKNLGDARLAIDAYAAVFEVLRVRIEDAPRREMENLLTTLRLNFVDKSSA